MNNVLNKIKWVKRTAIASFGILVVTLLLINFRTVLFGFEKGYAPDNFVFNFIFVLPAILTSLILGITSLWLILKYWKKWGELYKKVIYIGFSAPIICVWIFLLFKMMN